MQDTITCSAAFTHPYNLQVAAAAVTAHHHHRATNSQSDLYLTFVRSYVFAVSTLYYTAALVKIQGTSMRR